MIATRRRFLRALGALAIAGGAATPAAALTEAAARAFIEQVVAEVTELVQSGDPPQAQARRFTDIFTRYAATEEIARFVMGRTWREMSDAQRSRFQDAFRDYVGRVYSSLLEDYEGQTVVVTGSRDFGRKGILVTARARGAKVENTQVEYLVSDRGGEGAQIIDITAAGVSLLQSQRQEFAAMLDKRNGDVERFISDLAGGEVEAAAAGQGAQGD